MFQRYINQVLRDILNNFCLVYINNIIIYLQNKKEHQKHVREVLRRLQDTRLQCNINKCKFKVKLTKYLGFIVKAGKGLQMDPKKVKVIQEQQTPIIVKGVRSFLGFINFYQHFIKHYLDMVQPLTKLTHKDKAFKQNNKVEEAFQKLKRIFLLELALA